MSGQDVLIALTDAGRKALREAWADGLQSDTRQRRATI